MIEYLSQGQMALQMRSGKVPYLPGHWCFAAAGHVTSGEDYDAAAARELLEEAGVAPRIRVFIKEVFFRFSDLTYIFKLYIIYT